MGFGEADLPDPLTGLGHILVALEDYNKERNARPKPRGFEDDIFPMMPFVMRAGELLPWGTGESIPDTAWFEFWIEIPPGVTPCPSGSRRISLYDLEDDTWYGALSGHSDTAH